MNVADALYRSDFFPGLGWMLSKPTWDELSPKWPKAYPFINSYLHFLSFQHTYFFFDYLLLTGMTG